MRGILRQMCFGSKKLALVSITALALVALSGGLFTVFAVQDGFVSDVSPAPDMHKFRNVSGGVNITDEFCGKCHAVEGQGIAAFPHKNAALSECLVCHGSGDKGHAAKKAECGNPCHVGVAEELALETAAHSGMYDSLGEGVGSANASCQACHTHHPVTMSDAGTVMKPPIDLVM